ncbi:MAG: methionyl-tRNA formyltransferase [Oscillospiraceae bacterium]|nr:methionyl-tRNA formyltransferase [Oscillospiraceae bacterium]
MKTLFMGTPEFAAESLRALLDAGVPVCGVFTRPDKPAGRRMIVSPPPVKTLAVSRGVPVWQPEKLRDGTALGIIRELAPDLIAVVAYGRLLPEEILAAPAAACVNVHASLLPKYRGAAPIQWAVARGERETGVTTQYMAPELDTGDVILTAKTAIGETETAGELHDRLMVMGASLLLETVNRLKDGTAPRVPQDHGQATFAPILGRGDGQIDFTQTVQAVHDFVRGFTPWPGASWQSLRIWKAAIDGDGRSPGTPGSIVGGNGVVCGDGGVLRLLEVQARGGKRMGIDAYLRGNRLDLI